MAKLRKMTNRVVRTATRNLKRGIVPDPPVPTTATPEEAQQIMKGLEARRRYLQAEMKRLADDSSRRGAKKRIEIDAEIVQLEKALNT